MVVQQGYTIWLFDIAMENGPSIDGLPMKMVIFHGYVKPEGNRDMMAHLRTV